MPATALSEVGLSSSTKWIASKKSYVARSNDRMMWYDKTARDMMADWKLDDPRVLVHSVRSVCQSHKWRRCDMNCCNRSQRKLQSRRHHPCGAIGSNRQCWFGLQVGGGNSSAREVQHKNAMHSRTCNLRAHVRGYPDSRAVMCVLGCKSSVATPANWSTTVGYLEHHVTEPCFPSLLKRARNVCAYEEVVTWDHAQASVQSGSVFRKTKQNKPEPQTIFEEEARRRRDFLQWLCG